MIIAIILGLIAFWGCSRKNYPQKQTDFTEQNAENKIDTVRSGNTIIMPKDPSDRVIAMYGVPPFKMNK